MDKWLKDTRDALAAATGLPASDLELTRDDIATLLEVARIAARDSGNRTNAPLLCYLVGVAVSRSGTDLAKAVEPIQASSA